MSDTQYVWLRFRTRHSSGNGYWDYEEMAIGVDEDPTDEDVLQRLLRSVNDEHTTDSEHWRGVEGDIVACPPMSVLEQERLSMTESIARLQSALERNERLRGIVELKFIPVMRTNGLRAFVPDPALCAEYEVKNGYTFEREHALRFDRSIDAALASPSNEWEEF